MSCSPYFFVEKFNSKLNKYEMVAPLVWNYGHTQMEPADLFPYNGCHDLFDLVTRKGEYPEMCGIHIDLPNDVSEGIKQQYDECSYTNEWSEEPRLITPDAYWFSYADMYIYTLQHPTVVDWETYYEEDEEEDGKIIDKPTKPSPLFALKDRVDAFLNVWDDGDWENDRSQIRIVYWIL